MSLFQIEVTSIIVAVVLPFEDLETTTRKLDGKLHQSFIANQST
jgi:hypothetical protein